MTDKFKGLQKLSPVIIAAIAFLALRMFKISLIAGTHISFFSVTDALMPLTGIIGMSYAIGAILLRYSWRICMLNASYSVLVYHLPGLCASYYWASKSRLISIGLPLLCMAIFIVHPVGFYAAPYVLYWFIPVVLGLLRISSPVASAFTSTFIAHAVGSVLWLYTIPMTSAQWLSLIPIVAVERCCFAGFMILVYYAGSAVRQAYTALKLNYAK